MATPAMTMSAGMFAASDLQIEQWVHKRYGFVPHPFWIDHCKELYIAGGRSGFDSRPQRHECPTEKRLPIREAFVHFGMLPE